MPRDEAVRATPEVTIQADIGGMTVAFVELVGGDERALNARLDLYRRAINRQRAQVELVEALVDIQARREALASAPRREREVLKARAEERVRQIASFEAAHQVRGNRGEFRMSQQQRAGLEAFDAETERKKGEFAADREKILAEMPHYEARAERARRIIAGAERSEVIEQEEAALPEAAD